MVDLKVGSTMEGGCWSSGSGGSGSVAAGQDKWRVVVDDDDAEDDERRKKRFIADLPERRHLDMLGTGVAQAVTR